MNGEGPSQELNSWKEIANYLGVTERTAQAWERERGLPVRRFGGGPGRRGRVCAQIAEVDLWKQQQSTSSPSRNPAGRLRAYALATSLALLVASSLLLANWIRNSPGSPAACRLEPQMLVVMDSAGKELWRHSFPNGFWGALYDSGGLARRTWFGDLDGDGKPEVLFLYHQAVLPESHSTILICYSHTGRELWRWTAGRVLPELDPEPPTFLTVGLGVLRGKSGSPARIVVSSSHYPYYPHQVAIVAVNGKTLSEYWHSGHLDALALSDLDGDGKEEILLAGVSNANRQATFIVLDADRVSGASLETARPELQLHGFGEPHERVRLLLPRSCVSRKRDPYNFAQEISVTPAGIRFAVGECLLPPGCEVWYEFDRKLRLVSASPSDFFRTLHKDLFLHHQIDHPFDDAEERSFEKVRCLAGCDGRQ